MDYPVAGAAGCADEAEDDEEGHLDVVQLLFYLANLVMHLPM